MLDDQVKWEYLNHNIRKYTINFSKKLAKSTSKKKLLIWKQSLTISKKMKTMLIT